MTHIHRICTKHIRNHISVSLHKVIARNRGAAIGINTARIRLTHNSLTLAETVETHETGLSYHEKNVFKRVRAEKGTANAKITANALLSQILLHDCLYHLRRQAWQCALCSAYQFPPPTVERHAHFKMGTSSSTGTYR